MKSLEEYVNDINCLSSIFEDIDENDKQYYDVLDKNKDYTLWIDKHARKRQSRHSDFTGDNTEYIYTEYISDEDIKTAVKAAYSKIDSLFTGNRLTANKNNTNSFIIVNTKKFMPINVIGFVYKLNNDATYDICVKTVIKKSNFVPSSNNGKKNVVIKVNENLNVNVIYVNV